MNSLPYYRADRNRFIVLTMTEHEPTLKHHQGINQLIGVK